MWCQPRWSRVRGSLNTILQGRRSYQRASTPHLSPLAATFNSKQTPQIVPNPLRPSHGLFQIPELRESRGFQELKENCVARSSELVTEACNPDRSRNVAAIFDDLSDELCKVADMSEFVRQAHPDMEYAQSAEDACISISGLVEELNTHLGLYDSLKNAVEHGDKFPESEVDRHVAKLFLLDFEQSGIHLDDESRQMAVRLHDHILQIGQQFAAGTHQPKAVRKSVLPANIRDFFDVQGDHVILNGLHSDSQHDLAREAAYKIYYWHNPEQEQLLKEMLTQRHHLAQLCGYETFAHKVMNESLANNPENVDAFLGKLSRDLKPRVAEDYQSMLNLKKRTNPFAKHVELWDIPYYSGLAKNSWFETDVGNVSEYFSLGVCMEGLNTIFKCLYNVEIAVETPEVGEMWHEEVFKLAVKDLEDGSVLGNIYCDFFSRSGKPYQDCHFTIRGGRLLADGSYQNPVVVLMLNFSSPSFFKPTLLSGAMLDNLFHEMGHAMHSMMGRTKYQHVTGTRCSTDFAEVPSTLMEYFSSDPRVLSMVSKHYKTGESLPMEACRKFCAGKKVFAGVDIQTQLFYAMIDQQFHSKQHSLNMSTTDILRETHLANHNLPYPDGTAWQHRFSHLVGYGARYYSYLMARSVASSIWQKYFQFDPMNPDCGEKYRRECLAHGGGKPSHKLVSDYLGYEISPEDLSNALIKEVDEKQEDLKEFMR